MTSTLGKPGFQLFEFLSISVVIMTGSALPDYNCVTRPETRATRPQLRNMVTQCDLPTLPLKPEAWQYTYVCRTYGLGQSPTSPHRPENPSLKQTPSEH